MEWATVNSVTHKFLRPHKLGRSLPTETRKNMYRIYGNTYEDQKYVGRMPDNGYRIPDTGGRVYEPCGTCVCASPRGVCVSCVTLLAAAVNYMGAFLRWHHTCVLSSLLS